MTIRFRFGFVLIVLQCDHDKTPNCEISQNQFDLDQLDFLIDSLLIAFVCTL